MAERVQARALAGQESAEPEPHSLEDFLCPAIPACPVRRMKGRPRAPPARPAQRTCQGCGRLGIQLRGGAARRGALDWLCLQHPAPLHAEEALGRGAADLRAAASTAGRAQAQGAGCSARTWRSARAERATWPWAFLDRALPLLPLPMESLERRALRPPAARCNVAKSIAAAPVRQQSRPTCGPPPPKLSQAAYGAGLMARRVR